MARPLTARALLFLLALTSVAPPLRAEAPGGTVIALTVTAAAAPKPALRYTLLPELKDMNPGNPIHAYLKAFMEQNHFYFNKKSAEDRERWQTLPLAELPLEELRNYGGSSLKQADFAARLDAPDWQLLIPLRQEGVNLLLPDLQQLRTLAAALKVRLRGEIAAGRTDDAVRTAQTMLALSRHLGEHPTLIGDLVAVAVASLALGTVDEFIARPGSPNLYWALSDLPTPFIDLRKSLQGERMLLAAEFARFDGAPRDDADLARAVSAVEEVMVAAGGPFRGKVKGSVADWLATRTKDAAGVTAARERLLGVGLDPERVKKYPPVQVILLDEKREYEEQRDDIMKWMTAPWPVAEPRWAALKGREGGLFTPLIAAAPTARRAQVRLEQRLALLRVIEAVRLHAAAHGGQVPARLSDLDVPVPVDPFTGKPFPYSVKDRTFTLRGTSVKDRTFTLRGTPPSGMERQLQWDLTYEVTVRK